MNKKVLLIAISGISIFSIVGALAFSNSQALVGNADHVHNGYHYNEVKATSSKYGHKEHWTCCGCHGVFTENPGGDFEDLGSGEHKYGEFDSSVKYQYVTFDQQGGTGGTENLDNVIVSTDLPDIETPTKSDYYFEGYYSEENGGGTKYYDSFGSAVAQLTTVTNNTTLYANWDAREYSVNVFSNDKNKGTVSGGGTFAFGSDVTVDATPVGDYVFNGWYSDSNYKLLLSKDTSYTFSVPSGGKSLYAKFWTAEEEAAWDLSHGVTPIVNADTIIFGLYPQTIVSNPSQQLKNAGSAKDNEEFFYYDGDYYVKDVGNPLPMDPAYQFSDGTTIVSGTTYYFICEPITWNICATSNKTYTVDSALTLYAHRFDGSSNAYKTSELRAWLEEDFYSDAFQVKDTSSYIQTTKLADVGVDGAKVWAGSYNQYNGGWSRYSSKRTKKTTDFALCNKAFKSVLTGYEDNALYWTRSPYNDETYSEYPCFVDHTGSFSFIFEYENINDIGIAPAMTLLIE